MTDLIPLSQSLEFAWVLQQTGRRVLTDNGHLVLQRGTPGLTISLASRARLHDAQDLAAFPSGPLVLSPDHPAPWLWSAGALPLVTAATVAELDLTLDPDARWAMQQPKWRNRLRHAQGQDLRVARQNMPVDPDHWLLNADSRQQRARGYRTWPATLTASYAELHKGKAKLFTAYDGDEAVAAMLFLGHGNVATYHIGHTTDRGRSLSAHTLLLWEAASWLAANGYVRLDLGIIDTQASPGLARFKLGSGAQARKLGGTWLWWPILARMLRPTARRILSSAH